MSLRPARSLLIAIAAATACIGTSEAVSAMQRGNKEVEEGIATGSSEPPFSDAVWQ